MYLVSFMIILKLKYKLDWLMVLPTDGVTNVVQLQAHHILSEKTLAAADVHMYAG